MKIATPFLFGAHNLHTTKGIYFTNLVNCDIKQTFISVIIIAFTNFIVILF